MARSQTATSNSLQPPHLHIKPFGFPVLAQLRAASLRDVARGGSGYGYGVWVQGTGTICTAFCGAHACGCLAAQTDTPSD